MKVTVIDVGSTKEFAVSFLSDLHVDSPRCDFELLKEKLAKITEKHEHHRAIVIGDVGDFIVPSDYKRFSPSSTRAELATRDDFVVARAEYIAEKLAELPVTIDLIGRGNHEDEVVKRFGIDPLSIICSRIGCKVGWYEGIVSYTVEMGTHSLVLAIAYHHGAWGGRYAKGYNGALDYFSQIEGWDIAVYGHNHASRADQERRIRFDSRTYTVSERNVYVVNCSSWVNGRDNTHPSQVTPYDVRRGYKRLPNVLNTVVVEPRASNGIRKLNLTMLVT